MDAYATHIPMLAAIFLKSSGPVLELGCGDYSTLMLHEMCKVSGRKLVSTDTVLDWLEKFKYMENEFHEFHHIKDDDWAGFSLIEDRHWGMVFVDHAPGERRIVDIERLKDQADFIVIHDTQEAGYKYETVLPQFKYRFDYKAVHTETSVVSNTMDLSFLNELDKDTAGIIVSLGIGGIYPDLMKRLRQSCFDFKVDHWLWDTYPPGARMHAESPYGFKVHAIRQALQKGHKTILWADSACYLIRHPKPLFDLIKEKGIVIFGDGPDFSFPRLEEWVNDASLAEFGLERKDVEGYQLVCGALFGFDFNHPRAVEFYDELCKHEQDNWFVENQQKPNPPFASHRHDEAIMSLMTIKFNVELVDRFPYFQGDAETVVMKAGKDL